ncbi:DUF2782 domain-containing protein [Rhodanobacter sp. C03]|uniref:DUF2782 domain-containing protein n=1 Tax=Rhodanobacter sp. C03 TaxID=1945858 RepID=UPI0009857F8B|nr:DUF2782 domain-containing protein [Rhodanobacter sp. C03]OOG53745.1 hypothetical protein B0E48_15850 [Rhodanobacter sp. C03]
MKNAVLLAAASVLLASHAFAQSAPTNVPPPPGINDPGVKAVAPAAAASQGGNPMTRKSPTLPAMQDAGTGKDASLPQIRVRQEGDNTIQEYSHSGQVYMVVVTPKHGIQQTYMVDPQGRLLDEHGQKPVGPAMYKVLEWGKSKPAAEDSSQTNPDENSH